MKPSQRVLQVLQTELRYQFSDVSLLQRALTHRSLGSNNNERLEFLGDAVLGFVVAEEFFKRFPKAAEGQLSRLRSTLVKGKTLASVARGIDLGEYLVLGTGELKSGGHRRESILAGALEAIIGAVYLDGGIEPAGALVRGLLAEYIAPLSPESVEKDAKTCLQELAQSHKVPLPVYDLVTVEGEAHQQVFTVQCSVELLDYPTLGVGPSRRAAEQEAAAKALAAIADRGAAVAANGAPV